MFKELKTAILTFLILTVIIYDGDEKIYETKVENFDIDLIPGKDEVVYSD